MPLRDIFEVSIAASSATKASFGKAFLFDGGATCIVTTDEGDCYNVRDYHSVINVGGKNEVHSYN